MISVRLNPAIETESRDVRIFFTLFLMLTIIPVVELMLLLKLSEVISVPSTIGLVILTGIVGAALARVQGLQTLWTLQNDLRQGKAPTDAIADGVMILIAGALLVTPGIMTDAVGFSLLVPPIRRVIQSLAVIYAGRKIRSQFTSRKTEQGTTYSQTTWSVGGAPESPQPSSPRDAEVIDVDFTKRVD